MFFRAPRQLPSIELMLDDLGDMPGVARYLGVDIHTLNAWRAGAKCPRAVLLALFYESNYGISVLYTDAHNAACQSAALASSYERECIRLRGVVARLETNHDWGSANSPVYSTL